MSKEGPKPSEQITKTLLVIGGLFLLSEISKGAFSRGKRKEIGYRDNWTCQWEDGCTLGRDGQPARFQDGFMVDAAHHDHNAKSEWYDEIVNGRILCLAHHYLDELAKGHYEVLGLLGSRDPYTIHARADKKKYPWLNGYKTVSDIIREKGGS